MGFKSQFFKLHHHFFGNGFFCFTNFPKIEQGTNLGIGSNFGDFNGLESCRSDLLLVGQVSALFICKCPPGNPDKPNLSLSHSWQTS